MHLNKRFGLINSFKPNSIKLPNKKLSALQRVFYEILDHQIILNLLNAIIQLLYNDMHPYVIADLTHQSIMTNHHLEPND